MTDTIKIGSSDDCRIKLKHNVHPRVRAELSYYRGNWYIARRGSSSIIEVLTVSFITEIGSSRYLRH
jgi:hypothetical protein